MKKTGTHVIFLCATEANYEVKYDGGPTLNTSTTNATLAIKT